MLGVIFIPVALAGMIWCLWAFLVRPAIKRKQAHTDSFREVRPDQPIPPLPTLSVVGPPRQASSPSQTVEPVTSSMLQDQLRSLQPVTSLDRTSLTDEDASTTESNDEDTSSTGHDRTVEECFLPPTVNDWTSDYIELEPGLGVVCAKNNSYHDPAFKEAQDWLKRELNLFLIAKDNVDAVNSKECCALLASRLSDLSSNQKVRNAYLSGVPVILASEVIGKSVRDHVNAYLAEDRVKTYQQARLRFDANWELVSLKLIAGMKYFLTHSNSGYKLLEREERFLERLLGPKLETKNSIPKTTDIDMVVVPTLRTTSSKFIQVIKRKSPVLAVRAADLNGTSIGDEIPAWRWLGGDFFCYPIKD